MVRFFVNLKARRPSAGLRRTEYETKAFCVACGGIVRLFDATDSLRLLWHCDVDQFHTGRLLDRHLDRGTLQVQEARAMVAHRRTVCTLLAGRSVAGRSSVLPQHQSLSLGVLSVIGMLRQRDRLTAFSVGHFLFVGLDAKNQRRKQQSCGRRNCDENNGLVNCTLPMKRRHNAEE
jgi:hypothetical protein